MAPFRRLLAFAIGGLRFVVQSTTVQAMNAREHIPHYEALSVLQVAVVTAPFMSGREAGPRKIWSRRLLRWGVDEIQTWGVFVTRPCWPLPVA
eukprot:5246045-Amphidinium_carterae.1